MGSRKPDTEHVDNLLSVIRKKNNEAAKEHVDNLLSVIRKKNNEAAKDAFISGWLCAMQFIALHHDQPSMVEDGIRESGFTEDKLLAAQKLSGYQSRKMNKIIRDAFKPKPKRRVIRKIRSVDNPLLVR